MSSIIQPGAVLEKGYMTFPNGRQLKVLRTVGGRLWFYVRDIYKVLKVSDKGCLGDLAQVQPYNKAAVHPVAINEENYVNVVDITGVSLIARFATHSDCIATGVFVAQFTSMLNKPGKILWEQTLFGYENDLCEESNSQ